MYLTILARAFKNRADLFGEVKFTGLYDDRTKPVLLVRPANKVSNSSICKYSIRILPTISDDLFSTMRFCPLQNNVRPLISFSCTDQDKQSKQAVYAASPHYNMSILEDIQASSFHTILDILHKISMISKSFTQAYVLLRVWSRVHGVSTRSSPDILHESFLGLILGYLILERQISAQLSVQQMFRSTLSFIAKQKDSLFIRIRPGFKECAGRFLFSYIYST